MNEDLKTDIYSFESDFDGENVIINRSTRYESSALKSFENALVYKGRQDTMIDRYASKVIRSDYKTK